MSQFLFPLKNPSPNFESFERVLRGKKKPEKVPFVETHIDFEVIEFVLKELMGREVPNFRHIIEKKINKSRIGKEVVITDNDEDKIWIKAWIDFYYKMGYDYIPDDIVEGYRRTMIMSGLKTANDTAGFTGGISKGKRTWANEGKGIITSWEEFERFPWEKMRNLKIESYYKFLSENLSNGMKIMPIETLCENVMEVIMGYEGVSYLLYDQPELVKAVFDKMGDITYDFYKNVVSLESVAGIWHSDDLAYKTGTILSPETLRKFVLPWFKKYSLLAHRHKKMFWLHSCGNEKEIMEDLIENVKIDAYHSFEDVCCPITEYKKKYGDRIALLGGVDMDKLCRLSEENLRAYVRNILDECMPGGRYALGSGNSIANYVPVKNYLIMLEEGLKWK